MVRALTFVVVALLCVPQAFAQEKTADEQFQALGTARTKAEAAVRQLRTFFDENEARWRACQQSQEASIRSIYLTIQKTTEDEQHKAEDVRNQAVIEELVQRRQLIEGDWNKYYGVERPNLEAGYRQTQQMMERISQSWQNLANVESTWKDARLDLASLQAAYDAITARAQAIRASADKIAGEMDAWKKAWETAADTSTRPVLK